MQRFSSTNPISHHTYGITSDELYGIERLQFEKTINRAIVDTIDMLNLSVSPEDREEYFRAYINAGIELEEKQLELLEKYNIDRTNIIDATLGTSFSHKRLEWDEMTNRPDVQVRHMQMPTFDEFQNQVPALFPEITAGRRIRSITFQVTDGCNLCCTYCYQGNKASHMMPFEVATDFIDQILSGTSKYVNFENTCGASLEFIGGEPFLAIDLIDQITEYILTKMITEKHPWLKFIRFSICSNGVLYDDPKVQAYIKKYDPWLSFGISVDGNQELHDACRVFPDGSGSYKYAFNGSLKYKEDYGHPLTSKMTFSPNNVMYVYGAVKHLLENGWDSINANCVFEEGWTIEHAKIFYDQLKQLADWMIDNRIYEKSYLSLFNEGEFCPMEPTDDKNWCGGTGEMLAVDYKGDIYPCLRYMESSLGDDVKPIIIGTVKDGLEATPEQRHWVECLQCITRKSQSTEECINCPIAQGCAWCSALNYQCFKTLDKRTTFTCEMHKARALANVYFWNKGYRACGEAKRFECHVPREWALNIISEEEYDMLLELAKP